MYCIKNILENKKLNKVSSKFKWKLYVKVIEIIYNDSTINIYQNQNLFENFKNIKGAKNGPLTIENLEKFPHKILPTSDIY